MVDTPEEGDNCVFFQPNQGFPALSSLACALGGWSLRQYQEVSCPLASGRVWSTGSGSRRLKDETAMWEWCSLNSDRVQQAFPLGLQLCQVPFILSTTFSWDQGAALLPVRLQLDWGLYPLCFVAMIKHQGRKLLTEQRVYFDFWFQMENIIVLDVFYNGGGIMAAYSWIGKLITSPSTNRKQSLSWKWNKALSKPVLCDVLPTVRQTF